MSVDRAGRPDEEVEAVAEPWYERWFGEEYLRLYPHRDQEEADRAVALFLRNVPLGPSDRVLDLGCGAGRHLRALEARGVASTGLDLSLPLLRRARANGTVSPLVRGDMRRLPFSTETFAAASSFFTSFGYFAAQDDDRRVLDEIRRVLRPRGRLVLDFLNAARVRDTLQSHDVREVRGRRVSQERRLVAGGTAVEKTIRIEGGDGAPPEVFVERVRLYTPEALEALVEAAGFRTAATFGDYGAAPHDSASPRLILVSEVAA